MSNLPPEILIEVFSNLSHDNKQQCLLTCKAWYATVLPILNRFIEIKNRNDADTSADKISRENGLIKGSNIHYLKFSNMMVLEEQFSGAL